MYDVNDLRALHILQLLSVLIANYKTLEYLFAVYQIGGYLTITELQLCSTLTTRERVQISAAGVNG